MGNVASRSWPTKRIPDQVFVPTNAQVGKTQDHSRPHLLNEATSAADILADAVFYIDAQEHAASGGHNKVIRNRGWGGSVLDARCGSTSVPDTNDPLFLTSESVSYVYLPGITGNYLSVPDANNLDITGDIDLIVQVSLDVWKPANFNNLICKASQSGATNSFGFYIIPTTGRIGFRPYPDGSTPHTFISTVAPDVADGSTLWLRAAFKADNGASQSETKFYTSSNGTDWIQLGSTVTNPVSSMFVTTVPVTIGSNSGGSLSLSGKVYRAIIKNGIDGTTVLDANTSVLTTGSATSFTATTGQTVTISRSSSGRKTVVVPSADVKKVDDANVYLPGVNGNYLSVPSESALNISGDMEIVTRVGESTARNTVYVAKWTASGQFSYEFYRDTTNKLYFARSTNGTNVITYTSSTTVNFDGSFQYLKMTFDQDNGASVSEVRFYTSVDNVTFTQIGTPVTNASTAATFASTSDFKIGAELTGSSFNMLGNLYRVIVRNGINGTTVLDIDCTNVSTNFTPGTAAAFPAVTGQTVTMNSTAGSAMRVNPVRFAQGGGCWLFGTDDYMEVPTTATGSRLLDFGPNDSFTAVVVGRLWNNADNMALVGKKTTVVALTPATGFVLSLSTANSGINRIISQISDGTNVSNSVTSGTAVPGWTAGATTVMGLVANKQTNSLRTSANDTATTSYDGSAVSLRSIGSLTANQVIRIGATPAGSFFAAIELQAVAIFRRALTAAEVATLTASFQARYA